MNPNDNLWEDPEGITKHEDSINPDVYERITKKCNLIYGRTYNFVLESYLAVATNRVNELQAQRQSELEKFARLIRVYTNLLEVSKGED
jgi:hypothetical protein